MHCNHHSYFHPECAACHHVRAYHIDSSSEDTTQSTAWLTTYAASLPDFSSSSSSIPDSSSSVPDSGFSGFDGGSSGGGGTDF
jgi:hypothetical protein